MVHRDMAGVFMMLKATAMRRHVDCSMPCGFLRRRSPRRQSRSTPCLGDLLDRDRILGRLIQESIAHYWQHEVDEGTLGYLPVEAL